MGQQQQRWPYNNANFNGHYNEAITIKNAETTTTTTTTTPAHNNDSHLLGLWGVLIIFNCAWPLRDQTRLPHPALEWHELNFNLNMQAAQQITKTTIKKIIKTLQPKHFFQPFVFVACACFPRLHCANFRQFDVIVQHCHKFANVPRLSSLPSYASRPPDKHSCLWDLCLSPEMCQMINVFPFLFFIFFGSKCKVTQNCNWAKKLSVCFEMRTQSAS